MYCRKLLTFIGEYPAMDDTKTTDPLLWTKRDKSGRGYTHGSWVGTHAQTHTHVHTHTHTHTN